MSYLDRILGGEARPDVASNGTTVVPAAGVVNFVGTSVVTDSPAGTANVSIPAPPAWQLTAGGTVVPTSVQGGTDITVSQPTTGLVRIAFTGAIAQAWLAQTGNVQPTRIIPGGPGNITGTEPPVWFYWDGLGSGDLAVNVNPNALMVRNPDGVSTWAAGGFRIANVADPVAATDAANKQSVSAAISSAIPYNFAKVFGAFNDPTGFANRTDSVVTTTISGSIRRVTIAPVATSYSIYYQGTEIVKTTSEHIDFLATEGIHLFFFDSTGTISHTADPSQFPTIFGGGGMPFLALYYDITDSSALRVIEERHGTSMPASTHAYLHTYFGTVFESGGGLNNMVVEGSGASATHAQLSVDNTIIADEDIRFVINDGAPQTLAPTAQLPVFYLSGAGVWRKKTADAYPVIYSGTAGYTGGSGRLAYNLFSGGVWSLAEVTQLNFVLVHIYATTDVLEPIIAVQGQAIYTSLAAAQAGATTEINALQGLTALLSTEKRALATIIYQTSAGYGNVPKARIRATSSGANYVDWRGSSFLSGIIGAIAQQIPQTRLINTTAPLAGGGDLSADRTLSIAVGTSAATVAAGDDARITGALQKSGGTMTGGLNMGSQDLGGLQTTPAGGNSAVSKIYADTKLALAGGSMGGNIDMQTHAVYNMATLSGTAALTNGTATSVIALTVGPSTPDSEVVITYGLRITIWDNDTARGVIDCVFDVDFGTDGGGNGTPSVIGTFTPDYSRLPAGLAATVVTAVMTTNTITIKVNVAIDNAAAIARAWRNFFEVVA